MAVSQNCIGVVLAGGLSSRMGSDKALLPYHGQTLLLHQAALLASAGLKVAVSGEYEGFDCIPDRVMRCGPLGGIYSVALQYPDSALVVVAVDMLQISPEHVSRLRQSAVACHFAGQPLPAFFPNTGELATAIAAMLAEPDWGFSLHRLHSLLSSEAISDAEFEPMNVNTVADWLAVER